MQQMNIALLILSTSLLCVVFSQECQPSNVCQECTTQNQCTSCVPLSAFYLNATTNSCDNCQNNCRTCTNSNTCEMCFEGYFLNSTTQQCISCQQYCVNCDETGCTQCDPQTFLNNQKQCELCQFGCVSCDNNLTCFEEECIPWGYYYNHTLQNCQLCQDGCTKCSSGNSCLDQQYCNLNYFFDFNFYSCKKCPEGCLKCQNKETCQRDYCDTEYYFDEQIQNCKLCSQNPESNQLFQCNQTIQNSSTLDYIWIFKNNKTITYTHMSMIEYLPNNTIAVAFQGSAFGEGNFDQAIYLTFSYDLGVTWTPYQKIKIEEYAMWGPVLYWCNEQQKLWLFYSASVLEVVRAPYRVHPGGSIKYITSSSDSNFTNWSEPIIILPYQSFIWGTSQKMTANKMIQVKFNETIRWILPFWVQTSDSFDIGPQNAGVLISDDFGKTWIPLGQTADYDFWVIENSLVQMSNHHLYQVFRSGTGYIWQSFSSDYGDTWQDLEPSNLQNPDSKVSVISLFPDNEAIVITYNPSKDYRAPLNLAYSTDFAFTWHDFAILESNSTTHSFAYPTSQQIGNQIFTTYTDNDGIKLAIANIPQILISQNQQKSKNQFTLQNWIKTQKNQNIKKLSQK